MTPSKRGKGKYALIKLRAIPSDPRTPEDLAAAILDNPGCVDFGFKGSDSEFFPIKLKDKYAGPALHTYTEAAKNDDPEWSNEVSEIALRADKHPHKKTPD